MILYITSFWPHQQQNNNLFCFFKINGILKAQFVHLKNMELMLQLKFQHHYLHIHCKCTYFHQCKRKKTNLEAIDFASQSAVCFELWRLCICQWSVTGQDFHRFITFDWLGFVDSFRPHLSNMGFFLLFFLSFSLSLGCFYFSFSGLFVHFKILSFVRSLLSVQLKSTNVCKNENTK